MPKGSIRYHREDMDTMIRASQNMKARMHMQGKIDHFGHAIPQGTQSPAPDPVQHEGWCLKCKKKRMANTEGVEDNPNGSMRAHGKCERCGTAIHTFRNKADGQQLKDALESNRAFTGGT